MIDDSDAGRAASTEVNLSSEANLGNRSSHPYENYVDSACDSASPAELIALIDKLTAVDSAGIDEKLAFVLETLPFTSQSAIDVCKICCNKTGRVHFILPANDYQNLVAMHGQERAYEIVAEITSQQYTSPLWVYTDDTRLDYLRAIDPLGFCVYAASKIYSKVYFTPNMWSQPADTLRKIKQANYEFIVILHARLSETIYPASLLNETNELMHRYLALIHSGKAQDVIKFTTINPAEITVNSLRSDTKANLARIIKWLFKKGYIKPPFTYSDAIKIKRKLEGYSQFRSRTHSRGMTDSEITFTRLKDLVLNSDEIDAYRAENRAQRQAAANASNKQTWQNRLHTTGGPIQIKIAVKDNS